MKKLIFVLALALTGATYVSCSSDDDGGDNGGSNEPTLTSISLNADATEVNVGEDVTFTVTANYSDATTVDVTDAATLSIDGSTISNPYTTTEAGTFTVEAAYEDATATVDITVNELDTSNAVVYDGEVFPLTNSALVFWGGADPENTGSATHAYWSVIVVDGTDDIATQASDPTASNNYVDIEFLTPLDVDDEGTPTVVLPTTTNVEYLNVYEMYLNGTLVADVSTSTEENGSLVFGADITGEETSIQFSFSSEIDAVSTSIDYDSAFEGIYDASSNERIPGSKKIENKIPVSPMSLEVISLNK